MESEVLIESRRLERFIINVKIIDADDESVLGYSANMHTEGLMIRSMRKIPSDKIINIRVEHMQFDDEFISIPLKVQSIWCYPDRKTDFFKVGFFIVDPTPSQRRAITGLIEELML
jgi:hypothetical protein